MEPHPQHAGREPGAVIPRPLGRERTGLSALERKAVYRVRTEIAAMSPSLVVQILLWPEKLTDWARAERVTPALVYNMLAGFKPYHGLRARLAERLGVAKAELDHLVDAARPQPSIRSIPDAPADLEARLSAEWDSITDSRGRAREPSPGDVPLATGSAAEATHTAGTRGDDEDRQLPLAL